MHYLQFDLEIGNGTEQDYPVAVLNSPAGEARATMRFPLLPQEREAWQHHLRVALLGAVDERRKASQVVRAFGQRLFEALFVGDVRSRYDVSQVLAEQQAAGLRLRLRILPPELAAVPWEYLYDSRPGEYLCLIRQTPIVRYLELPQPIQPLTVRLPLRILGMVASPKGQPTLHIAREQASLEEAIRELAEKGLVELTWLPGQTWRDLQQAMQGGPWHIFHYIGHGAFDHSSADGVLMLANEAGETEMHSAVHIGRLLADHRSLRFVLLNACQTGQTDVQELFSGTATTLARRGIPAVLAMQYQITDRAAIELSRSFYTALAGGLPVDAAVTEARKAISFSKAETLEWGTPVLYMRSPDGVLFDLPEPRSQDQSQPQPGVARPVERGERRPSLPALPRKRTSAFISFHTADERSFKQLQLFLAPFKRTGEITYWDPTQLVPGEPSEHVVAEAIASAKLALLLVSPAFLASDHIAEQQLGPLLYAASQEGVRIVSVIVRPCAFEQSPLAQYEPVNRNQPVNKMTDYQQDTMWQKIALLVREVLGAP